MYTTRLNLLMQRSIVYSRTQVVTHHYQRISSLQYLLQMQVQAQLKCSSSLTQRMIPFSYTMVQQFKVLESNAMLTLTKMSIMHDFTHRFACNFQSKFVSTHSRSQRSFQGLITRRSKSGSPMHSAIRPMVCFIAFQLLLLTSSRSRSLGDIALNYGLFGDITLEIWARLRPFGDSPNALGDPQAFFSSCFQSFCSFLPSSVDALPHTPNT
ncbi:hypothetical protein H5410_030386 [Solanum commersonii]|uniref:Uncharacterized protein n=1 Tax=Solanum commersonii TaxID=4109 RepID=A0A9J5YH99_SOLCO|nr:hypothetical protein H5410_030386 [Solanum commersonii]